MLSHPVTVALPIADRRRSYDFYRTVLGLEPFGEPAADGMPEPLGLIVNDGLRIVLVPTTGFGWVVGDHPVAPRGTVECQFGLQADDEAAADALLTAAIAAGAEVVEPAARREWGYTGTLADPDGHQWSVVAP